MIPNPGLDRDLEAFLARRKILDTSALVFPLFEVQQGVKLPVEKKDLIQLIDNRSARPYQIKVSPKSQNPSNIAR